MSSLKHDNSSTEVAPIAILQEEAVVRKADHITGRVRIHLETDTVDEIISTVLREENVEIERVIVGTVVTEMPAVRIEDGVTIIPIVEEVIVVTKQLVLKEELRVHRHVTTTTVEAPVSLRKQHITIERLDGDTPRAIGD